MPNDSEAFQKIQRSGQGRIVDNRLFGLGFSAVAGFEVEARSFLSFADKLCFVKAAARGAIGCSCRVGWRERIPGEFLAGNDFESVGVIRALVLRANADVDIRFEAVR